MPQVNLFAERSFVRETARRTCTRAKLLTRSRTFLSSLPSVACLLRQDCSVRVVADRHRGRRGRPFRRVLRSRLLSNGREFERAAATERYSAAGTTGGCGRSSEKEGVRGRFDGAASKVWPRYGASSGRRRRRRDGRFTPVELRT